MNAIIKNTLNNTITFPLSVNVITSLFACSTSSHTHYQAQGIMHICIDSIGSKNDTCIYIKRNSILQALALGASCKRKCKSLNSTAASLI